LILYTQAASHELIHTKLHDRELNPEFEKKDRRQAEIEAESVSFVVANHWGLETGANSFGYIAEYSRDRDLKELNASLDTIRKTSAELIDAIDKERGIDLTTPHADKPEQAQTPEQIAAKTTPDMAISQTAPTFVETRSVGETVLMPLL
jgi:hypothetical protein